MKQKRILILGGGGRQLLPLIQAAKNEGFYVILVGNMKKNPGIGICDKHYEEDCTNLEKVLDIAKKEKIDGVLGNAEYAMKYVAAVAEKLGLIGNSSKAVHILNSKYEFRNLLKEENLYCPKSFLTESFENAIELAKEEEFSFPAILKPEVCSSSMGTTVINNLEELYEAKDKWSSCKDFSNTKKVVIEEFVKMPSLDYIIDGDIFVHHGEIIWNGLFSSKRSEHARLFPMTQSYPVKLTEIQQEKMKSAFTKIIKAAGVTYGALNVGREWNPLYDKKTLRYRLLQATCNYRSWR